MKIQFSGALLLLTLAGCAHRAQRTAPVDLLGKEGVYAPLVCTDPNMVGYDAIRSSLSVEAYKTATGDKVYLRLPGKRPHVLEAAANGTDFQDQSYAIADHGSDLSLIVVNEARALRCRAPGSSVAP